MNPGVEWDMTFSHNGFTMLELMVVVGIIAILSLRMLPS